jgi:hypothetical protein
MNERIRELAEQAQDWVDAQAPWVPDTWLKNMNTSTKSLPSCFSMNVLGLPMTG